MTHTPPAAVLWDMDGTLVDTEPFWMLAESDLVHDFGGEWSHADGLKLVGSGLGNSAQMLQAKGVLLAEAEIIERLTDHVIEQLGRVDTPWRPGACELLLELRTAGVPTALVTMSLGRMAHNIADRLGFVGFDTVVSGDEVVNSKPHPEPYLRAIQSLGVVAGRCVAIEDSQPGVASAAAAGAVVVGVPFLVDLPADSAHAMWPTLAGRTIADLSALLETVNMVQAQ